jgi:arabinogalactan endo-1,4-beta-galactosidase
VSKKRAKGKGGAFIKGADVSLLKRNEDAGAVYTENGRPKDALEIFGDHGFNYVRLRLFHTPILSGSQVNDLAYTLELARRIKAHELGFLLDFHYSDTWADPHKQFKPAAWEGLPFAELVDRVFTYTRDSVAAFREQGYLPDMVQVGNEITYGMLWDDGRVARDAEDAEGQWARLSELVRAGIRGVEDGAGAEKPPRIMIHVDAGGDREICDWFYGHLLDRGVDPDVIGLTYYPFWHGSFDDLGANLESLALRYGKDLVVVETGFPQWPQPLPTPEQWDVFLSLEESLGLLPFPMSPEGQKAFLEELIRVIRATPDGRGAGLFYWAPEHIEVKGWEGPDEHDAHEWYPRALFDQTGEMAPGLAAFES